MIIELVPVGWITYDGVRLESSMRGIAYDPRRVKMTLNRTTPPPGQTVLPFD